jgi:hypothetical protein
VRGTPVLTEAQPLDGYAVRVRFEDGTAADVDLYYLLDYGGVFEPLRDPAYFAQLRADAEAGTSPGPTTPTSRPRRCTRKRSSAPPRLRAERPPRVVPRVRGRPPSVITLESRFWSPPLSIPTSWASHMLPATARARLLQMPGIIGPRKSPKPFSDQSRVIFALFAVMSFAMAA